MSYRQEIREETRSTLRRLLTFYIAHSVLAYISEKAITNFRDLEEGMYEKHPIKGVGVKAVRSNLRVIDSEDGGFLHMEEDLFPGEASVELQMYPYKAASAAYVFTIMEMYGNTLVELVNPTYFKHARQAWHHRLHGDMDISSKEGRHKAKVDFAAPFGQKPNLVPIYAVKRLVELKSFRNDYMHEAHTLVPFDRFFQYTVATILSLHFLLFPNDIEISVYPFYDYHDKWGNGRKEW